MPPPLSTQCMYLSWPFLDWSKLQASSSSLWCCVVLMIFIILFLSLRLAWSQLNVYIACICSIFAYCIRTSISYRWGPRAYAEKRRTNKKTETLFVVATPLLARYFQTFLFSPFRLCQCIKYRYKRAFFLCDVSKNYIHLVHIIACFNHRSRARRDMKSSANGSWPDFVGGDRDPLRMSWRTREGMTVRTGLYSDIRVNWSFTSWPTSP